MPKFSRFPYRDRNRDGSLASAYFNARKEYWWLSAQVFSAILLAALSVVFIELWVIWLHSECYTIPIDKHQMQEGKVSLIITLIVLMLFWSPLIGRGRYIKYFILTCITISPTVYYLITAFPYDKTWHNGWCW